MSAPVAVPTGPRRSVAARAWAILAVPIVVTVLSLLLIEHIRAYLGIRPI